MGGKWYPLVEGVFQGKDCLFFEEDGVGIEIPEDAKLLETLSLPGVIKASEDGHFCYTDTLTPDFLKLEREN